MPTSSSPSTSRRLLALLSLLQARRDWPARVLAERLEVSERTVRRDVDRLRELDYEVDATRGPEGGYRLASGTRLPPLLLDEEQAVAVTIALRTTRGLGTELDEAADRALGTIERLMPSALAQRVAHLDLAAAPSPGGAPVPPAVLLAIGEAIRAQEELRFDYASPDRPEDPGAPLRRTEPHHLLLRDGRWYVIGRSPQHDDWRVLRADRMTISPHRGRRFERRELPGGDPARWLSARFKGSAGDDTWPCWGEATVHGPLDAVRPYVREGTVEQVSAGACRVRLGAWSWGGLAALLLGFDQRVDAVSPEPLREAFARLAERSREAAAQDA